MDIKIISSYYPKNCGVAEYTKKLQENLLRNGITPGLVAWNHYGLKKLIAPILKLKEIKKVLQKSDIVHLQYEIGVFGILFPAIFTILVKHNRTKIIITAHEDYTTFKKVPLISPIIKIYHDLFYGIVADQIIVHTLSHKKNFSRALQAKTVIIPHPVATRDLQSKQATSEKKIFLPGFINCWKGHDLAIKAMQKIVMKDKEYKLIIAGESTDHKFLMRLFRLISKYNLEQNVVIQEGYLSPENYDGLFKRSKLCILPYRKVTMSGVLADIVSWQVPCVLSDLPEFMEYTDNRLLYFPKDDPHQLYETILKILDDQTLYHQQKSDMKFLASKYSWERAARDHIAEYHRILEGA